MLTPNMPEAMNPPKRPRVLWIDDDAIALRFFQAFLESSGYRALTTTDGLEGLALARQDRPDVILLDVMMRGLSGFDICRKFRADPALRDIPIILLTVLSDPGVAITGREALRSLIPRRASRATHPEEPDPRGPSSARAGGAGAGSAQTTGLSRGLPTSRERSEPHPEDDRGAGDTEEAVLRGPAGKVAAGTGKRAGGAAFVVDGGTAAAPPQAAAFTIGVRCVPRVSSALVVLGAGFPRLLSESLDLLQHLHFPNHPLPSPDSASIRLPRKIRCAFSPTYARALIG